jgi:hypothetical protein
MYISSNLEGGKNRKSSLHYIYINPIIYTLDGALLRLDRYARIPSTFLYMLEPRFSKRQEAKVAIHLFAISRGIIESIEEVDNLGQGNRQFLEAINSTLLPKAEENLLLLNHEYRRVVSADGPPISYSQAHKGTLLTVQTKLPNQIHLHVGWGAKMQINLPTGEKHTWRVRPKYRTKGDAKYVLALLATEEGAIRFLQKAESKSEPTGQPDLIQNQSNLESRSSSTRQAPQAVNSNPTATAHALPERPVQTTARELQGNMPDSREDAAATVHPLPERPVRTATREPQGNIPNYREDSGNRAMDVDKVNRRRRRTPSPAQEERNVRPRRDVSSSPTADLLRVTQVDPLDTPSLARLNGRFLFYQHHDLSNVSFRMVRKEEDIKAYFEL